MSYDILYWAASLFKSGYGKMDRYSTRDSRGRDRRQQSLVSRQSIILFVKLFQARAVHGL